MCAAVLIGDAEGDGIEIGTVLRVQSRRVLMGVFGWKKVAGWFERSTAAGSGCTTVCGDRSHSANAVTGTRVFEPPEQGSPVSAGVAYKGGRPTAGTEQFMDPKLLFWRSRAAG